jgi:predicted Fe-Mo cluster-binding NifX family protein
MKIAAITDDGQTISMHFGRAEYYLVCTIEDGQIAERELRSKMGHRQFAGHDHEETQDARGHGFGKGAEGRHASMIASITDCDVLLVRGMGRGAYMALEAADIRPIVTDIEIIEEAVLAHVRGDIIDHTDRLH